MDKYNWEELRREAEEEALKFHETARPLYFTKRQGEYTIEDYEQFPEDFRCELIDGVIYDMSAPTNKHELFGESLRDAIKQYVKKNRGRCIVSSGIFDVHLFATDNKTMVQPDILVICETNKFSGKTVEGAPDLVVETLSPSTRAKDRGIKLRKYLDAGVREVWLVDLEKQKVVVYMQDSDADVADVLSMPTVYTFNDTIPVGIFDGECQIDMREVYAEVAFLDE